ncbi:hydroxypyruvate isomerase family protein [Phnomibacter ginsenosidimutans]|uniref:TIM barrel protein n=1 Tax=Phnomibacter ginsenosidimutans TaxID=2676868 RepID=A0A6I6GS53_9BACT|nr:TIM barrel protein [Phnomibacter ginsenosidimutans]QGW27939.1 TIM barrel protein [Phnomibacter ginsenosidimutans]
MSSRASVIKNIVAGTAGISLLGASQQALAKAMEDQPLKGNINHSVCRWTYDFLSLDELCVLAKEIGIKAIDLIGPKEWHILKKHGIDSSMCNGAEINLVDGWNNKDNHAKLIQSYTEHIELVSKAGYKNLIFFTGNRRGMDDETGMQNTVEGLKKIVGLAEKKGVVLQLELFNSKINHKDYMADKSAWGVEMCKRIGSENVKLLYDIYHMQINEGDVIRTIQDFHPYFGHYHTAGVPGRHEIDDTQELNYPAIMQAIVKTGYKGYVAQEFIPVATDKIASLKDAIRRCDV